MSVPKILHRIWLNPGDDPMPPVFVGYGRQWAKLHPGWECREWCNPAALPPLRNQDLFDRAQEVCPRDWKRFQADILRLELLWLYGGIYVDTDVEPLRPVDDLLSRGVIVAWSPNRGRDGSRLLTQAVIGAEPRHPFIGACLDELPRSVERYRRRPLAQMIGPHMVTRVWQSTLHGVRPLPERTFYPQSIRARARGRRVDAAGAYTIHRWNTTLRRAGKGLG